MKRAGNNISKIKIGANELKALACMCGLYTCGHARADSLGVSAGQTTFSATSKLYDAKESADPSLMMSFSHLMSGAMSGQVLVMVPARKSFQGIALAVGYELSDWPKQTEKYKPKSDVVTTRVTPVWLAQASLGGGRWRYVDTFNQTVGRGIKVPRTAESDLYGYLVRGYVGYFVSENVSLNLEVYQIGSYQMGGVGMQVNATSIQLGTGWWYE